VSAACLRILIGASILLAGTTARASDPYGWPEQGSEALGRGGAWVARASDPIALARNPAGLAGQPLRLSVGEDLAFARRCFARVKAASDTTDDGVAPGASYPRVCDDAGVLPAGYVAMTFPISPRFAIGAGVVTPTGVPRASWPSFVDGRPAPQRYLLVESTALMAIPTVGAAYEPTTGLRIGASFGWGLAWVRSSAAGAGLRQDGMRPEDNDTRVTVIAKDLFVPRATLGAQAAIGSHVELGAMVMASAPIDAVGDARTEAGAFSTRAAQGDGSAIAHGDTAAHDCGQPGGDACGDGGNARVHVVLPMQASAGIRVRVPRARSPARDPLETELGDVEVDLSWTQASAIDGVGLHFPADAAGSGTIPVPGTAGVLPPDASSARRFRDVFGVHVGGDANVVPGVLALRAGAFVESRAGEPGFVGLETFAGTRVGLSVGATARIADARGGAFDLSVGYLHMFVSEVAQTDPGADGVRAITGTPCDLGQPHAGSTCPDGGTAYRTKWPVGIGTVASGLDVLHVGAAYRF
jgi:long-chain fatty acid transport protein